ncbi:class A beta-lactamase-related serine hydrolase [Paenibacillus oralis]|uniref:Class A beta-lactamase-related serine hydrolase n=1 Tax=Paenibacillus oralis TaxID=2490856 RepID=A0A3P3UAJ3_9BACL|nr:serine hydrolase domain-containing protein [Paenibacillus oralis]RRJ67371.1 class A beta-lactamase-related serine hydrolase [Paenibacillus oralis]
MKRMGAVIMAALLLALPAAAGIARADGTEEGGLAAQKAREMAEALIGGYGVNGVQYAIRDEGKVVLSGGLGVAEDGSREPISKDTMFGIGSVSKMYVTAAAMMLVDSGKIDIDRPLTDYIPDFKMADERYKRITPRMLMNHSAGLYGSHYKNSMLLGDNDTENFDTLLENLRSERLKSDPGEYSVYANDGFQLLQLLVERVSGMSYSEFLARNVSGPLELTSTKTPLDVFDRDRLAPTRFPGIQGELPPENANVVGTGGIYSTAEELTLFSEVLTGERPKLLSKALASAMQNPEYRKGVWVEDETNTFGYGLGWDSVDLAPFGDYGIKAVTKGGDTIVYHSALIALPEENISIALLTSGGSSIMNTAAASNILLVYLKETGGIADILPDKTFEAPVKMDPPDGLQAYSGLYGNVGSTLHVTIENGEVELPGLLSGMIPAQTYVYTGEEEFTGVDGRTVISFDEQTNGHTYIRVKTYLEFPGLGQSVMAYYEYQKLDENPLDKTVAEAWTEREGRTYYALDEKINSLFYLSPSVLTKTIGLDKEGGYANGTKITDEDHAVNVAEIPVMNGRDAFDLDFFRQDGTEYLRADGRTYTAETALAPISGAAASIVTIPDTGYVRWYKIGAEAAGQTMTVDFPQSGGFAVYNAEGALVNFSVASGINTALLPEGGLIVFGGGAGDVFKISLTHK